MEIFVNTNYDFIKWRFAGVIFSLCIILAGVAGFFAMGLNVGIDFSGGANIVLRFQEQPPIAELRKLMPDATIQQYGKAADNSVLIRLPEIAQETDYAGQAVRRLNEAINGASAGRLAGSATISRKARGSRSWWTRRGFPTCGCLRAMVLGAMALSPLRAACPTLTQRGAPGELDPRQGRRTAGKREPLTFVNPAPAPAA